VHENQQPNSTDNLNAMNKLLVSLTTAVVVCLCTSSQATLLMYEPFDYPAGERLGGSTATGPVGKTNANGQVWITRSPATLIPYDEARDVLITAGSMSYPGLAPSLGNSVRYGTNAAVGDVTNTMYTVAIDLPGDPFTSNVVYYSMIVHLHSSIPAGGVRTCYAAFSEDPADPVNDAGYGVITSSGTGNIPLPAGAWIRNSGATQYHLGAGKQNGDGTGTSAGQPSWQSGAVTYTNQQGNVTGFGQDWATVDTNPNQPYFIVMKYEFKDLNIHNDDVVSIWVNPAASTLGYDDGEWLAGVDGGAYYSATNSTVTADIDAYTYGIQSFMLIGNAQASTSLTKSIDVSVDELRIGTTWADVTPTPTPGPLITEIAGAGTTSVTVTWTNVQVGTNYVLQYNTNLSTTNWSDLPPVTAVGPTASQTDNPPSGDTARFYRVLNP
jgi:hypothetical protein